MRLLSAHKGRWTQPAEQRVSVAKGGTLQRRGIKSQLASLISRSTAKERTVIDFQKHQDYSQFSDNSEQHKTHIDLSTTMASKEVKDPKSPKDVAEKDKVENKEKENKDGNKDKDKENKDGKEEKNLP